MRKIEILKRIAGILEQQPLRAMVKSAARGGALTSLVLWRVLMMK